MAFNMDNLEGVAGEVIGEVRDFEDNWGMPRVKVTGRVLRADHPAWKQHVFDTQSNRPEARKTREAVNERIFSGIAPKGFRAKPKTENEAHATMLRRVAENEKLVVDVLAVRELKGGIAAVLLQDLKINGESVVERKGASFDLSTVEGRLGFLDHGLWEFEQDGEPVEFAVPIYRMNGNGPVLDEAGEPVRNPLGGWNFGDAVAALARDEAENTEKFVRKRKAALVEPSAGTATGITGSGSENQSAPEEP